MSSYLVPEKIARVAAVVFVTLASALVVFQTRRGEDRAVLAPVERGEPEPLIGALRRCRTITSDDTAGLDACRRVWAENRQHFFASAKSTELPTQPASNAPAGLPKSQDQAPPREVDQGRTR
ncbi:putative entry exclusion protein TrbK-alt [Bradyrhizobium sp.]|uniref:putative entry exclusion protein TrbK-alt n=1 Tax=Bradyrhizobium sp. TaxID=376 RepID=UPI003C7047E0